MVRHRGRRDRVVRAAAARAVRADGDGHPAARRRRRERSAPESSSAPQSRGCGELDRRAVDGPRRRRSGAGAGPPDGARPGRRPADGGGRVNSVGPPAVCMLLQNHYDTDIRVRRKAEALVAAGYSVDVLALRGARSPAHYTLNGVHVRTVGLAKKRGSIVRYAFEYAAFFGWAIAQLSLRMWRRRYVVVEVNTLPDFLVFAAAPARWMRGARIVLDMHEITPEFYMSKYAIRRESRLIRLLAAVERWSFDFADHVVTVNEPIRQLLTSRGLPPGKSSVVMNAVDEALFRAEPAASPEAPSPDRFVMMYHGTLTSVYGLPLAVEALALARREVPGAELWILGAGPERQELERLAQARGVDAAVRFVPPVPPSQVAAWVSRCDAGVLPMRRDVFLDY